MRKENKATKYFDELQAGVDQWKTDNDQTICETVFPGRKDKRAIRRANKEKYNAKHQ